MTIHQIRIEGARSRHIQDVTVRFWNVLDQRWDRRRLLALVRDVQLLPTLSVRERQRLFKAAGM